MQWVFMLFYLMIICLPMDLPLWQVMWNVRCMDASLQWSILLRKLAKLILYSMCRSNMYQPYLGYANLNTVYCNHQKTAATQVNFIFQTSEQSNHIHFTCFLQHFVILNCFSLNSTSPSWVKELVNRQKGKGFKGHCRYKSTKALYYFNSGNN